MIELETTPEVNVQDVEYQRLLGYPRNWSMEGRAAELAAWARDWYARHGRPWVYTHPAASLELSMGSLLIDGTRFISKSLEQTLRQADAHTAILVAVGAGVELELEARRLWQEEKPDEYFFLEVYGSAVVEHLTTMTGARLCGWAEERGMAVLPHYSPGYPDWDIVDQAPLLDLMRRTGGHDLPVEVMESGMLRPKKSLLAVFGVTRHTERLRRLTDLVPCENCSYQACQYRRAPYNRGGAFTPNPELPVLQSTPAPQYSVNLKALKRWASERLRLETRADGAIDALFLYEGTTCTNMGRPLAFHYRVKLGPREEGYPILEQCCSPAPFDSGHTAMCKYVEDAPALMGAINKEKPLAGRPLEEVLSWQRPRNPAGCYCEPEGRDHKWGLVLETIHYALATRESESSNL